MGKAFDRKERRGFAKITPRHTPDRDPFGETRTGALLYFFHDLVAGGGARHKVSIKGSVVGPSGAPVSGAWVLLQRTREEKDIVCSKQGCKEIDREMKFEEREDRQVLSTFSDARGAFLVKVPVGKGFGIIPWYHLIVLAPGYYPRCRGSEVPDGKQGSTAVSVELRRIVDTPPIARGMGKLKLSVFDQSGAVYSGLDVLIRPNSKPVNRARPEDSAGLQTGEIAQTGEFEAELPAGDYDVVLLSVGVCDEVTVAVGETAKRTYKVGPR